MFYLHLLIKLISSKKYWRIAKNLIQTKFYFYKIRTKIQTKEGRLNFLKKQKTRFRENFDFRELCVSLKDYKYFPAKTNNLIFLKS